MLMQPFRESLVVLPFLSLNEVIGEDDERAVAVSIGPAASANVLGDQ